MKRKLTLITDDESEPEMEESQRRAVRRSQRTHAPAALVPTLEERQAIFKRNATTSPLLRLPAELRIHIYRYVFGGHVVHVQERDYPYRIQEHEEVQARDPGQFRTYLCRAAEHPNGDAHEAEALVRSVKIRRLDEDRPVLRMGYDDIHDKIHHCCGDEVLHGVGMSFLPPPVAILKTCRQAAKDGSLLPFEEFDFAFSSAECMAVFLQHLTKRQTQAIKKISLVANPLGFRVHRTKLKALRNLTVLVEVPEFFDFAPFTRDEPDRRFSSDFKDFSLDHAAVVVYNCVKRHSRGWTTTTTGNLADPVVGKEAAMAFERRVERELLRDWTPRIPNAAGFA